MIKVIDVEKLMHEESIVDRIVKLWEEFTLHERLKCATLPYTIINLLICQKLVEEGKILHYNIHKNKIYIRYLDLNPQDIEETVKKIFPNINKKTLNKILTTILINLP